jgi:hypothetical protein
MSVELTAYPNLGARMRGTLPPSTFILVPSWGILLYSAVGFILLHSFGIELVLPIRTSQRKGKSA